MTTIYFVRHAQSAANLTQCFAGFIDVPLTELGRKQAACTAEYLADVSLSAVYSSDLSRAYDTACAIAQKHNLNVQTNPNLREINGGDWEGRNFDDLNATDAAFRHFTSNVGTATCTNGESVADMLERIRTVVALIVAKHPNEAVCVVCHGTPIRALTATLTGVPLSQMHTVPWASNASVTVAEYISEHEGKLISADQHAHLKDLVSKLPANI